VKWAGQSNGLYKDNISHFIGMRLSFKCYFLCLPECIFIKVTKINTQTNIHCESVTPTFYDFKIMGSLCSCTAFWWHILRECPLGSGSFSPTYWDPPPPPQDCQWAGVPSDGAFHLIYVEPPLPHPFFGLSLSFTIPPLMCMFAQGAKHKRYHLLSWEMSFDWTNTVFPLPLLTVLRYVPDPWC